MFRAALVKSKRAIDFRDLIRHIDDSPQRGEKSMDAPVLRRDGENVNYLKTVKNYVIMVQKTCKLLLNN